LAGFKRSWDEEAEENRVWGDLPTTSLTALFTLQPKAKRVRLCPEDKRIRDERIKAEKVAKRVADAVRLEGFKQAQATKAKEQRRSNREWTTYVNLHRTC
jgi:hypothetical protein